MSSFTSTIRYVTPTPRSQRKQKGARYYGAASAVPASPGGVSLSYIESNFVTLSTEQTINKIKDFLEGFKVGGLPIYKSQDDVIFIDANVVVRGGVTAWGTDGQTAASVFDALPIDGVTIKRDDSGVLYAVAQGTGGIDESQLADYLTTNNYATTSDISSALSGYATQSWVTGKGYLTGITGTMVSDALGYIPYNSENFTKANIKSTLGISDWALASAKPTYTASEVGALALTGGTINGSITATSFIGNLASVKPGSLSCSLSYTSGQFSASTTETQGEIFIGSAADPLVISSPNSDGTESVQNIQSLRLIFNSRFFTEIAATPNANHIWKRNVRSGAANPWERFVTEKSGTTWNISISGTANSATKLNAEVLTDLNNATAWTFFTMTSGYGSIDGNKPNTQWASGLTGRIETNDLYRWQLAGTTGNARPYWRRESGGSWNDWQTLAFTSDLPTNLSQLTDDVGYFMTKIAADTLPSLGNIAGYGYANNGWKTTGPAITFGIGTYKAGFQSNYSSGKLYFGFAKTSGENLDSWKIIAFTSDIPTSLKNPNALSWSGYSSGSYDGSTAQNIALPTKLSQLTDDVVAGKYLPLSGGTVNGNVRINKFLAVGAASSSTNTARAQIHLVSSGANPCDLYLGADDTLYWSITARNAADAGGFNKAFALYDVTNSAYRLIVLPNGNIGIGTTSPETRLHVNGYAKITNDLYLGGVMRNANATWLLGEESSNGAIAIGSAIFAQDRYLNNLNGKLRLTAEGGVEAQLTYLDSNPTLGNLDAKGVLRLTPTNGFGLYSWVRNTGDGYVQVGSDSRYATPKSFNLVMQALGGNVGIGTASPTSKLHAVSSSGWGVTFDGGSKSKIVGAHADGFGMLVMSTTPTTSDSYIFRVWQGSLTGASGSGTAVLDVRSNGVVNIGGNLLATGGITAQNSSDRRLKKNIRKFNASKVLMSLGAVWEYEYIDSEVEKNHIYEGTHYGLIYQHVRGTTLDVMCHEREDGMGALNYLHPKFISLIAGATMENISEVEKLKRKIRHLEAKVKQLEQRA